MGVDAKAEGRREGRKKEGREEGREGEREREREREGGRRREGEGGKRKEGGGGRQKDGVGREVGGGRRGRMHQCANRCRCMFTLSNWSNLNPAPAVFPSFLSLALEGKK